MKWFKHDVAASHDAKLMKVRHKYGAPGYGLYWYMLELIAGNVSLNNITFELEHDAETISLELGLDQMKCQEMMKFMANLGLFEECDGRITCLKMAQRLDQSMTSNPKMRGIIQSLRENHDGVMMGHDGVMTNPDKVMQDKTRLDKNNSPLDDEFDGDFWPNYPRKEGKQAARKAYRNLSKKERGLANADILVREFPSEKRFIPLPATYIHGKRWEDEREAQTAEVSYL